MGTTLTVCLISQDSALVAHVGDTRLYHLRDKGIVTRTRDQTEAQELVDQGVLSQRRALNYHRKNILTSVLSNYTDYELYQTEINLLGNDRLILTTDGSYSLIKKSALLKISISSRNAKDLCDKALIEIESGPIKDDYSMIVYQH